MVMQLFDRLKGIFSALLIRGGVMGIQFLVSVLIALVAGPVGAGIYGLYNAWLAIFTGIVGLGSNTHVLRSVSVMFGRSEGDSIKIYIRSILKPVIFMSALISMGVVLFGNQIAAEFLGDETLSYVIITAMLSGIFTVLARVGSESLKAMGRLNSALILEWALLPSAVVLTLVTSYLLVQSINMQLLLILRTLYIFVIICMLFSVLRIALRGLSTAVTKIPPVSIKKLLPFWGSELSIVGFMNTPLLVLPYFVSTADIGVFSIAQKLILTVTSALVVLTGIYGPKMARAYAEHNLGALKRLLLQTQIISFTIYAPLFTLFFFYPELIMRLFGDEFESGAQLLRLMAVGQLVGAICGLGDFTLHMVHKERWFLFINIFSTALALVLCVWLISTNGVLGCALAVAYSLAVKQLLGYLAALFVLYGPKSLYAQDPVSLK